MSNVVYSLCLENIDNPNNKKKKLFWFKWYVCCGHLLFFLLFYLSVSTKIEKEKREHAKQHGMIRTEITGAEIAEEMEKERRIFQLQMCEVSMENVQRGFSMHRVLNKHQERVIMGGKAVPH